MLKYKIKIPTASGVTHSHLNIPITMENQMVDQADIIKTKFVDVEVEKSINPIIDYEKVQFKPFAGATPIQKLKYEIYLLDGAGSYITPTTYADIGFSDSDLERRANSFVKSFVRLSFYDTDIPLSQNLISFITLFPQFESADVAGGAGKNLWFKIGNPKLEFEDISTSEGFNIFHYYDEVEETIPKELYMKAEFNNAKSGKSINLKNSNVTVGIEDLVGQLYTRYILQKDSVKGYYYEIDETYSTNITGTSTRVIKLWELDAL
jgi:hypothetical protein